MPSTARRSVALSCARKPTFPERLDIQLNEQARQFISDSERNQFEVESSTARISKIFDWFAEDFEDAGGVANYLVQFAEG